MVGVEVALVWGGFWNDIKCTLGNMKDLYGIEGWMGGLSTSAL